jgi:hypothetical protein
VREGREKGRTGRRGEEEGRREDDLNCLGPLLGVEWPEDPVWPSTTVSRFLRWKGVSEGGRKERRGEEGMGEEKGKEGEEGERTI